MRIAKIIAAAVLAFTGIAGTTTAASAAPITVVGASAAVQDYGYGDRYERRYREDRRYRGDRNRWDRRDRHWDRGRGYDRGRYYRGHRARRVCWNEWRRGHRVTVCRRR
jgi:hypothetical protein